MATDGIAYDKQEFRLVIRSFKAMSDEAIDAAKKQAVHWLNFCSKKLLPQPLSQKTKQTMLLLRVQRLLNYQRWAKSVSDLHLKNLAAVALRSNYGAVMNLVQINTNNFQVGQANLAQAHAAGLFIQH